MVSGPATRHLPKSQAKGLGEFLVKFQASIVVLNGDASGSEYVLDSQSVTIGRGPGVDLAIDDSAMSREHAVLELVRGGFRVRDLGSTNGVLLNGETVQAADLKHGDRFRLGDHTFQLVIEERERKSRTYALPDG